MLNQSLPNPFSGLAAGTYTADIRLGRINDAKQQTDWQPWQTETFKVEVYPPVRARRLPERRGIYLTSTGWAEYGDRDWEGRTLVAEDYVLEIRPETIRPVG